MSPKIHKFILTKILGWHITPGEGMIPEKKAIFLCAPHTSIIDFIIGFFYYRSVGGHLKIMIKKESFFWPLGPILKALGAFPMDRSNPQQILIRLIRDMNESEVFHLAICPEGTRKAVRKWKTGYHTIARETGAVVYLAHFDYKKKEVGRGQIFELSGNAREDTDRIQAKYEEMKLTAYHPDGYVTK